MPIVSGDILVKLSVKTGSAGNTVVGTAAGSLGKYISTTQLTDNILNNAFDDISGTENAASTVDYRCIFIHNSHATLTATVMGVYISAEVALGANISIGLDPAGATALGSASAQAAEIATELSAPAGVTFSAPTSYASSLSIGSLAAGQVAAVWIRRSSANSAAKNNDGATLTTQFDTAE